MQFWPHESSACQIILQTHFTLLPRQAKTRHIHLCTPGHDTVPFTQLKGPSKSCPKWARKKQRDLLNFPGGRNDLFFHSIREYFRKPKPTGSNQEAITMSEVIAGAVVRKLREHCPPPAITKSSWLQPLVSLKHWQRGISLSTQALGATTCNVTVLLFGKPARYFYGSLSNTSTSLWSHIS